MQTRLFAKVCAISLALISIACNKAQNPVTPPAAHLVPASNSAVSAPSDRASTTTPAETKPNASGKTAGIRAIDVKPLVETHLGDLNPDLAELDTACGEGEKPLQTLAPVIYGDLDGDGQEEAVVLGWSCLSGNGGADFRGVLKLMSDGKLSVLPIEAMPKRFKGRDTYADLRGHMILEIKEGRLHEVYAIYTGAEANCCPEGGERRFIYHWDGHRFALDDMIDVPPAKSGN
ncbi:MAG: hypothetical protein JWO71_3328 [Candidatus Acidoferrum typicum]|nr:hypothetical protein [Candidatus Acidoferrum typicum]